MRDRRSFVWLGLFAVGGLALRIAYVLTTKNPRAKNRISTAATTGQKIQASVSRSPNRL